MSDLAAELEQGEAEEETLTCLLIEGLTCELVLPVNCVAEAHKRHVEASEPIIEWRGRQLQLLDLGDEERASEWVIVCNRTSNPAAPEFYGIRAKAMPRLLQLFEEDLEYIESPAPQIGTGVRFGLDEAVIPNIEQLEASLAP